MLDLGERREVGVSGGEIVGWVGEREVVGMLSMLGLSGCGARVAGLA